MHDELDALLATLSRHGVTDAEFSADGKLTKVSMIPLAMTGKGEDLGSGGGGSDDDQGSAVAPVDEAALRMLGRARRERAA